MNSLSKSIWLLVLALFLLPDCLEACLWDRDTLADERKKSPQLAELIFGPPSKPADPAAMRARIDSLRREPKENDPAWWNDLAGAYIRLEKPDEAAKLLEPVVAKFSNDYGVHANLGTAYHLLGRYREAEREIARDLELNPDGHFGLEKYHLALLQHLSRAADYQQQHVYVDEFTAAFTNEWDELTLLGYSRFADEADDAALHPAYRDKWNLATDTNLHAGVMYMASLNPKEPACFVMLGIAALQDPRGNRDLHLAMAAFEKAIRLGSTQEPLLRAHIGQIRSHIHQAGPGGAMIIATLCVAFGVVLLLVRAVMVIWRRLTASPKSETFTEK